VLDVVDETSVGVDEQTRFDDVVGSNDEEEAKAEAEAAEEESAAVEAGDGEEVARCDTKGRED